MWLNHCNVGDASKESENFCEHSSQAKRRRLHFNSEFLDPSLGNVEISPAQPRVEVLNFHISWLYKIVISSTCHVCTNLRLVNYSLPN